MTFPKTRNWQFNVQCGALAFLAMSLSACSLEERKTARVVIDLSELHSDRAASSRWAASSVNATAMSTPAQPTWGSGGRAVENYSFFDCVMLNVMGEGIPSAWPDKPGYRPGNLDLSNACSYTYPGTYSIPTSINQTTIELSVSVQKGPARLVQLIGFKKPAALRCEDITLPMMMPGGVVTDRYEIGITKVDLMSDATVEIQGNIASAKPIDGCGGPQTGSGPMISYFGDFGFRFYVPDCSSTSAIIYLFQMNNGYPVPAARKMSNAPLACVSNTYSIPGGTKTEYFIDVPFGTDTFRYNGALNAISGQSPEPAIQTTDRLALELWWTDSAGNVVSGSTSFRRDAKYDFTPPGIGSTNPSLNFIQTGTLRQFVAQFYSLDEAGFASIRFGGCASMQKVSQKPVAKSVGPFSVTFDIDPMMPLYLGTYSLVVEDYAGNGICPASIIVN